MTLWKKNNETDLLTIDILLTEAKFVFGCKLLKFYHGTLVSEQNQKFWVYRDRQQFLLQLIKMFVQDIGLYTKSLGGKDLCKTLMSPDLS